MATLAAEPFLPLIDALSDAVENRRARPLRDEDAYESWFSWTCVIRPSDQGFEMSWWSVSFPVCYLQPFDPTELMHLMVEPLAYCAEHELGEVAELYLSFDRDRGMKLVIDIDFADGSEASAVRRMPDDRLLQELFVRWSTADIEAAQAGQPLMRDPSQWWSALEQEITRARTRIETLRGGMMQGHSSATTQPSDGERQRAVMIAEDGILDDHEGLFRDLYEQGAGAEVLRACVKEWQLDTLRALDVLARRNGREEFTSLDRGNEFKLVWGTVELLLAATSLRLPELARELLQHPAIAGTPYRPFEVFALLYDVPLAHELEQNRTQAFEDRITHKLWLKVTGASPARRQAAFEKMVSEWDDALAASRTRERWCWAAVCLAGVFGLDDAAVREVRPYPTDLAEMSRELGVEATARDMKLPGSWKRPTPPKVLEPAELRGPHAFAASAAELAVADFAALVSPLGELFTEGDFDQLLDRALFTGTAVMLDWRGIVVRNDTEQLQAACLALGLRVPGRQPPRMPKTTEAGMARFDAWLEPLGARLVQLDIDSDDVYVLPVLAADYEHLVGRTIGNCTVLATTMLTTTNGTTDSAART